MEKKNELKEKLVELKKQIKINSKDAHWMENAMREYESLIGQLKHEPIVLDCGKEVDEWAGETFRVTKTTTGIMYHTYGGYTVFCTPNITGLYETLNDLVENKDKYDKLEGEERDTHELDLSAKAYCLSLPAYAFSDPTFMYDTAMSVVKWLRETSEQALNTPLRDETPEDLQANQLHRDAELGIRYFVDQVGKEVEEIKNKQ